LKNKIPLFLHKFKCKRQNQPNLKGIKAKRFTLIGKTNMSCVRILIKKESALCVIRMTFSSVDQTMNEAERPKVKVSLRMRKTRISKNETKEEESEIGRQIERNLNHNWNVGRSEESETK
jgi:hypothetical protein